MITGVHCMSVFLGVLCFFSCYLWSLHFCHVHIIAHIGAEGFHYFLQTICFTFLVLGLFNQLCFLSNHINLSICICVSIVIIVTLVVVLLFCGTWKLLHPFVLLCGLYFSVYGSLCSSIFLSYHGYHFLFIRYHH